ncbi:MAG: multicopper oxidase domain-containing protein [Thermoleophilia bacterium]
MVDSGVGIAPAPLIRAPRWRHHPYGSDALSPPPEGAVRVVELRAALARDGVGATRAYGGAVPGPAIRGRVGDRLRLVVTNDLPVPTTFDIGGPLVRRARTRGAPVAIAPGDRASVDITLRRPGVAVYGCPPPRDPADQGLLGAVIVDPPGGLDPREVEVVQVLHERDGDPLVNGCAFPFTDAYEVPCGRRVLVRVVNAGSRHHVLRLMGERFRVVRVDGRFVAGPGLFPRDAQDVAPGESLDLELRPRAPGALLLHRHTAGSDPFDDAVAGILATIAVVPDP